MFFISEVFSELHNVASQFIQKAIVFGFRRQSGAKIPKRLAQHPVPEYVRKCILEQRDVTTVLPVLVKV